MACFKMKFACFYPAEVNSIPISISRPYMNKQPKRIIDLKRHYACYNGYKLEASWNVMAHAQKPHFVFRRNGRVHLNRRWAPVHRTTGSRGVRISGSNAGYTMFRGSVKGTCYPLLSPVSASHPLPCVAVCHHISIGVYEEVIIWGGRRYSVNCSGYRSSNYIRTEHSKSWSVGV